jgi:histidinol dehydrogenase
VTREERESQVTSRTVRRILCTVRERGERAVLDLTRRYDGAARVTVEVSPEEWALGASAVDPVTRAALQEAEARIARFARAQRRSLRPVRLKEPGIILEQRLLPVERVGIYVPGGRHSLCSSVLMGAVPARVAGCREVVLATPPRPDGTVHPAILAAANLAGIDRVFAMGGAQAIAALAFGAGPVPAVDLIVGPGNRFVTEAKMQLASRVGIDFVAGPSELAVIADLTADAQVVAADLLAQAEHDPDARLWLLTVCAPELVRQVRRHLRRQLASLPEGSPNRTAATASVARLVSRSVDSVEEACAASDEIAPEHLSLQVQYPERLVRRLGSYGSLFVGRNGAVAFGDYVSGPNHTLPTSRAARHTGGLSVLRFCKVCTVQRVGRTGARRLAGSAGRLASLEGLEAHRRSVAIRVAVPRIAAVLFDFDGVLIKSEPWHWQAMRDAIAPLGISLTWPAYKARYLHFDDHGALRRIVADAGVRLSIGLDELVAQKRRHYRRWQPPDGGITGRVVTLVRAVARKVPVGVVSSAARDEIEDAIRRAGLQSVFATIIGAEDVAHPKPDPEGYRLALRQLVVSRRLTEGLPVLAVEDSPGGARAARGAGLEVFGVTTTYSASRLRASGITRHAADLSSVSVEELLA